MSWEAEIEAARASSAAVAMTALVDVRDWERVEQFFAPQVTVDYSSLFPLEPETLRREELIARWRGLVPGFDATRHALTNVEVEVHGDQASGSAEVVGTHYLDGETWTPAGRYFYRFHKIEGEWKISALTYTNEREDGDRGLVERAAARAAAAA